MISDEAVEAAKKIAYERYGSKPDAAYLRTILEAAAPKLTESAWEEGYGHGYKHGYSDCLKQNGFDDKPV